MLIKFGAIVVDGRGKLGGHVFAKNRGGNYMRTKVTPTNPQTVAQAQQRANLGSLSQGWSQLTPEQRSGWNNGVALYAKTNIFGDSKNPTGKNLYTGLNRNLFVSGQASIDNCPEPGVISAPTNLLATASVGLSFLVDISGTEVGQVYVVRATPSVSAGTTFVKNRFRDIQSVAGTAGSTNVDILTEYESKFGTVSANDTIFIEVFAVNANGQASPRLSSRVTIL